MKKITDIIKKARLALDTITPLSGNCGQKCGAACCRPVYNDGPEGMYLFPGELELYRDLPSWANIEKSELTIMERAVYILSCDGVCERHRRPLACRIFPLLPGISEWDGETQPLWEQAVAVIDRRAYAVCPLAETGIRRLSRDFVRAACDVAYLLSQNPDTLAFMQYFYERQQNAEDLLFPS